MSSSRLRHRFPGLVFVMTGWLLWGLVGCQTSPPGANPERPEPALPESARPDTPVPGVRELPVVAEESLLLILVYRGGPMARLGHNHVIASQQLTGSVQATDDPQQTRFDISFPVNQLSVDDPAMREQAGADFPQGVPQSARDGTRRNLLSASLLDGEQFPTIRLRAVSAVAVGAGYEVDIEVSLKEQVHRVRVPVAVTRKPHALTARGEFTLRQSALGLKPFSVAMGTLVVLDEMRVRFAVTARATGIPPD